MLGPKILLQIIYQSIGVIAVILSFISFQFKNNKKFLVLQSFSCGLFALQFYLTGALVAVIMNLICVLRGIFYALNKNHIIHIIGTILFVITFLLAGYLTVKISHEKLFIATFMTTASIASTIGISTKNHMVIRALQITVVSPFLLVNNIYYFSIGAIISEVSNMVSVVIALVRKFLETRKKEKTN